jgi:hypothetical protein
MVASASPGSSEPVVSASHSSTGFWQHRWAQNGLPLLTSLAIHLTLLAIGIALYQVVTEVKTAAREQTIIPESSVMPIDHRTVGIPNAKTIEALIPNGVQTDNPDSQFNPPSAINHRAASLEPSSFGDDPMTSIGVTPATHGAGIPGLSDGPSGTGPFGIPTGHGDKAGIGFVGPHRDYNVRKVVFLCDASGSMLGVFGALKQKLKEAINPLSPTRGEEFNVIFFSDDNCFPLFKDGTQMATDENKARAMEFIDNAVSTGGTQPMPAIKFALAEKPELLYVLTDGFDQIADLSVVVKAFQDGNRDGKIRINTIFLQSDEDPQLENALQRIATDGKGTFTKVLKADMQ